MKKTIFTILFVFSVATNLAVAATVLWYMWSSGPSAMPVDAQGAQLTRDDVRLIDNLWPRNQRASLMENREKIRQKKLEVLDFIARHPGDLKAIQQKMEELASLRAQVERQALTRISEIVAELPQEKRGAFLGFLQNRACMGPGMGRGMCPVPGQGVRGGMGGGRGMQQRGMQRRMGPCR